MDWEHDLDFALEERAGRPFIGGRLLLSSSPDPDHFSRSLPLEIVPELALVDLTSNDSILEFAQTVGVLGAWQREFAAMALMGVPVAVDEVQPPIGAEVGGIDTLALMRARKKHAAWGTDHRGEFLDEFRIGAGGLLGLFAILQEVEAKSFSPRRLASRWPRYCPWEAPRDKRWAWQALVDGINAATSTSVGLSLAWLRDDGIVPNEQGFGPNRKGTHPGPPVVPVLSATTLYGVCALELSDHLLGEERYRTCANEPCGRLFTVQEGRSRYGGHRTDSRYHSVACKNAQEQREYRRRKKTQKGSAR